MFKKPRESRLAHAGFGVLSFSLSLSALPLSLSLAGFGVLSLSLGNSTSQLKRSRLAPSEAVVVYKCCVQEEIWSRSLCVQENWNLAPAWFLMCTGDPRSGQPPVSRSIHPHTAPSRAKDIISFGGGPLAVAWTLLQNVCAVADDGCGGGGRGVSTQCGNGRQSAHNPPQKLHTPSKRPQETSPLY